MIALTWTLITLVICSLVVIYLCHRAPIIEEMEDEEDRLVRIFLSAMHHRDQLDACFAEVVEIHGVESGSCAADELADVIYGGESYSEAMSRIAEIEQWEREEG